jgi:predicted transposase YdaD
MTAKVFDAAFKTLVEISPEGWPLLLGQPKATTEVIDADIATVSGAADKVLLVRANPAYLIHLEFVTGHDVAVLPSTLHFRNTLLNHQHGLRVRSVIVLLHSGADSPVLTGERSLAFPNEKPYDIFRYQVLRVWQLSPARLLSGSPAMLPLVPISNVTKDELPGIMKKVNQRLNSPKWRPQASELKAAALVLMGLRYPADFTKQFFQGGPSMKESSTYQAILEEGRNEGRNEGRTEGALKEARRFLLLQGESRFGSPDAATLAALEAINDLKKPENLGVQLINATSWKDLLGPSPRSRKHRQS